MNNEMIIKEQGNCESIQQHTHIGEIMVEKILTIDILRAPMGKEILQCLKFEQNVDGVQNDGLIQNILKCSIEGSKTIAITTLYCKSQYK